MPTVTKPRPLTLSRLQDVISRSWSRESSFNPDLWAESNPSMGQCTVTALVVQDYLGGQLKRVSVSGRDTPSKWHWYNVLPDGTTIDLTRDQFPPSTAFGQPATRNRDVLRFESVSSRYNVLKRRVEAELGKP